MSEDKPELGEWSVEVLRRREAFEALFDGFRDMYAATRVDDPSRLLPLFAKRGYREVDIMVGGCFESHHSRLRELDVDTLDRLVSLTEGGALTMYTPAAPVVLCGNLYLLYNNGSRVRVIHSSASIADMTPGHALHTAVWADFNKGDPRLAPHIKAYENHLTGTKGVLDSLVALMRLRRKRVARSEVIRAWKQAGGKQ